MKYYVCLRTDYDYNSRTIGEYLSLDVAQVDMWHDWSTLCDNDKKYYSKNCYFYEIQAVEEHEDGEIEFLDVIERIDVDDMRYDL